VAVAAQHERTPRGLDPQVAALIAVVAAGAAALAAITAPALTETVAAHGRDFAAVFALTLVLQLFSVGVYGRGSVSVSAIGILTAGFVLTPAAAVAIGMAAALVQWLRARGQSYKAVFDAANYAIAAAAATALYHSLAGSSRIAAAVAAGVVYALINNGLLCLAMSLSEQRDWRSLWRERFHWARVYFLLFGPLALAATTAYKQIGLIGLAAFALPPGLLILSVRQYLTRTAAAVEEVRAANARLRRAHRDTIAALSRSIEAKDYYTGGHTERVAAIAVALAQLLGYRGAELEAIEIGALLHDVGKIGIPEQILRKQGPLDDDEWTIMRNHPVISDQILADLDLDPIVRQCARSSHERIDGSGYPDRLAADEIPLPARIVFVADAYDALTSARSYRPARPAFAALAEIQAHAGHQFCPRVVDALQRLWHEQPHLLAAETPPEYAAA
jgi:putative nucleotidyltransferase with HDIG domain